MIKNSNLTNLSLKELEEMIQNSKLNITNIRDKLAPSTSKTSQFKPNRATTTKPGIVSTTAYLNLPLVDRFVSFIDWDQKQGEIFLKKKNQSNIQKIVKFKDILLNFKQKTIDAFMRSIVVSKNSNDKLLVIQGTRNTQKSLLMQKYLEKVIKKIEAQSSRLLQDNKENGGLEFSILRFDRKWDKKRHIVTAKSLKKVVAQIQNELLRKEEKHIFDAKTLKTGFKLAIVEVLERQQNNEKSSAIFESSLTRIASFAVITTQHISGLNGAYQSDLLAQDLVSTLLKSTEGTTLEYPVGQLLERISGFDKHFIMAIEPISKNEDYIRQQLKQLS